MKELDEINYERIAAAITFILTHFKEQPHLDEVAAAVHLSPFHFQRLFSEWAGTSPKKFLQYTSLAYAKDLLKNKQATLFDTAYATGLSTTSRLHDLFMTIEGMTPAEYRDGAKGLCINYRFAMSPFGQILIASTQKGICHMAFFEQADTALSTLKQQFPNAQYQMREDAYQKSALSIFSKEQPDLNELKLHLKGTDFQLKVWESLLKIPLGNLVSYGDIAGHMLQPNASRAVGTAIGSNPVAFLIPCHRVIQASGKLGGYMWGTTRKLALIGWEAAQIKQQKESI